MSLPTTLPSGACEKSEQWQQALGVLAVMQQSDPVPSVTTYNAATSACEEGEQWQKALGLVAVMRQSCLLPTTAWEHKIKPSERHWESRKWSANAADCVQEQAK